MNIKKSGHKSPDIVVSFKFETATSVESFEGFVKYINRESAVIVEGVERAFDEHLDKDSDFEKMISYTKRESAIVNKDEKRTGLFSSHSNNLSIEEMDDIKEKLNEAQINGHNLWNPVVSFDIAYLISIGVLEYDAKLEAQIDQLDKNLKATQKEEKKNPQKIYQAKKALEIAAKSRKVDQEKLKAAVQKNMPQLLKSEGFSDDAFWWGSIHLNTKHIHIHVSFSEVTNSRKTVVNQKNGLKEPRGKLKLRHIERFRSNLYHALDIDEDRQVRIMKEVEVAKRRESVTTQVDTLPQTNLMAFYLAEAYERLPEDGKWQYNSNRKEFKEAKLYLTAFVNEYLKTTGKEEFQAWQQATREQLKDYKGVYSNSDNFKLEQSLQKREEVLKAAIANRVLKNLKENPPEKNQYGENIEFLNSVELEKVVDEFKESKLSRKELGAYKWMVKVSYAEAQEILLKKDLANLKNFEDLEMNKELKTFSQKKIQEKIQLAQFEQKNLKLLLPEDSERYRFLKEKHLSARDFPIHKVSEKILSQRTAAINQEIKILKSAKDSSLVTAVYGSDKKTVIAALESEKKIFDIKSQINVNNRSDNRQANRQLFMQLKKIYGEDDGQTIMAKINRQKVKKLSTAKVSKFRLRRSEFYKQPIRSKNSNFLGNLKMNHHSLGRALDNLSIRDLDAERARRVKRRSDELEEREEQKR